MTKPTKWSENNAQLFNYNSADSPQVFFTRSAKYQQPENITEKLTWQICHELAAIIRFALFSGITHVITSSVLQHFLLCLVLLIIAF